MGRAPKTAIVSQPGRPLAMAEYHEDDPNPGMDPGVVGDEILPDDLALTETLNQIGAGEDGAKVMVYAIGANGKDEYMYSCSPAEFAAGGLDEIRNRYGGGEYRIRVYGQGRGVLTHRRITIREARTPDPTQQAAQAVGGIADLAKVMQQGFESLGALMVRQAQQAPAIDPAAQRMALLQEMAVMRDLFAPATPPGGGMSEALGMVKQLMDLQRDMMPPATDANGNVDPFGVLMKGMEIFGKPIADALQRQQAAPVPVPAVPSLPSPALPAIDAGAPVYNPAQQTVMESPDMNFFIKQVIGHMAERAKANEPPEATAVQIVDQAPAAMVDALASDPNWFEQVCAWNSAAAPYREWFGKVRDAVVAELTDTEENGTQATGSTPAASS